MKQNTVKIVTYTVHIAALHTVHVFILFTYITLLLFYISIILSIIKFYLFISAFIYLFNNLLHFYTIRYKLFARVFNQKCLS